MRYCDNEQVIGCDVDDTLILHRSANEGEESVEITCPYDGIARSYVIHKPHIKLLRDRKSRGCEIIIWSQGGPQWAKAVVEALGLQDIEPFVFCKPFMIVDDLPASAWLSNRTYIEPSSAYGNR